MSADRYIMVVGSDGSNQLMTLATAQSPATAGYNVYLSTVINQLDDGYLKYNGDTDVHFSDGVRLHTLLPNTGVTSIQFHDFEYWATSVNYGASSACYRPHASDWETWTGSGGTYLRAGETLTLTEDIDVYVYLARCLKEGTLISMADGTQKPVERVKTGDKVMGYEGEVTVTYSDWDIDKPFVMFDRWTFSDGSFVDTVHAHRLYNVERKAFVYMTEWILGEHTLNEKGEQVAFVKHEEIKENVKYHTIFTSGSNTYFANGLLCGNRYSVIEHGN